MDEAIQKILETGFLGAIIVAMGVAITWLNKQHREDMKNISDNHRAERAELRKEAAESRNKLNVLLEKNTVAVVELKEIIKSLKK